MNVPALSEVATEGDSEVDAVAEDAIRVVLGYRRNYGCTIYD